MAKGLFFIVTLVLFLGFSSHKAFSWGRNQSRSAGTGGPCPPEPTSHDTCESRVVIYGYPCEDHKVTTKDGFILGLQRIPHGRSHAAKVARKRRIPVLLQHGIMVDSVMWLLSSPEESLGYILADSGYDVWFSNSRGTRSSRQHTAFSTKDPEFWEWSWDQLAAYDLPAVFQYVYEHTGCRKIHYIGHSLGTLLVLAAFSEHQLLGMVRSAALLCPIAYIDHIESKFALVAARNFLAEATHWLGFHEFNPVGPVAREFLSRICEQPGINCYDLLTALAGPDCCLNTSAGCVFLDYEPQPTSTRTLIQLAQMVRKGTIQKYDYNNDEENTKHYGKRHPPAYNLSAIPAHLPLFLTHGGQDYLGDVHDTRRLLKQLKWRDQAKIEVLFVPKYAHADFMMAYNAPQLVYEALIAFFNRH